MNSKDSEEEYPFSFLLKRLPLFLFKKMRLNSIAALLYVVVALIFLQFSYIHPNASAIWPLSGLSIGFLVLFGRSSWPTIFVGAFIANLITNITIQSEHSLAVCSLVASGIALSNTLEALAGAGFIIRFINGKDCLDRSFDIVLFIIFVVFIPPALSAVGSVLSLAAAGFVSWDGMSRVMLTWYTANVYGVLLVTPCLFTLCRPFEMKWRVLPVIELLILFSILIVISQSISGFYFSDAMEGWLRSYMVIPVLLWLGFRFNYPGVLSAMIILSATAMAGTMHGYQAFPAETSDMALLNLQLFLGIVTLMSILFVALHTELKLINQRLEEMVDIRTQGIKELLEEKKELIAIITHDLKSPILGLQNILRLRHSPQFNIPSGKWETVLDQMEETCAGMSQLINRSLKNMEADFLSETVTFRRVNVNQLLKQCMLSHIIHGNEKGIEIVDNISGDPVWLLTDEDCIRRIIDNLLSNAIKFSPRKSSIQVISFQDGKYFYFTVSDQGFGLSKNEVNSLFLKFKRLRYLPSESESHGLGLFSVLKLVRELKGEVRCSSVEGKGSDFVVQLPLVLPGEAT